MPQSPFAPSEPPRHRWQFSIRGMLLFTTSVAIGLSAMQICRNCWFGGRIAKDIEDLSIIKTGWLGGLMAIVVFWMCLGLLYQVRDLWRFLKAHPNLDSDQRRGARFEMFWRFIVVILFAFNAVLAALLNRQVFAFPECEENFLWNVSSLIREGIFAFLILTIVGSIPVVHRETKWSFSRRMLYGIVCLLSIAFCLERWMDTTVIPLLVHIATHGIDMSRSNRFTVIDAQLYQYHTMLFFWWSLCSGIIVIANGFFLRQLAWQWSRGRSRRLLWTVLLILGVIATSSYVFWIWMRGLWQISPYFAEVGTRQCWHSWAAATVLLVIAVTTLAYKMTADWNIRPQELPASWRKNLHKYYHESRSILLPFGFTLIGLFLYGSYRNWLLYQRFAANIGFSIFGPQPFSFKFLVDQISGNPAFLLWFALLLLTVHRACSRRKNLSYSQACLPCINRAKFIAIWLATAAFTVSGALTLVWMSFGLWFNPWFGSR